MFSLKGQGQVDQMSAIDDYNKEQYRRSAAGLGPVLTVLKHGCYELGSEESFQWLPLVPTHWSPVGLILSLSGVQLDDRQGSSRRLSTDWKLWDYCATLARHVASFMYFPVAISVLVWSAGRCVEADRLFRSSQTLVADGICSRKRQTSRHMRLARVDQRG